MTDWADELRYAEREVNAARSGDLTSRLAYARSAATHLKAATAAISLELGEPEVPLWLLLCEAGRRHTRNGSGLSEHQIPVETWKEMARAIQSGRAEQALLTRESPLAYYLGKEDR
jgi:hypothetical protein